MAAVIDLFPRRVAGWSMTATMASQLVADALMMAIWRRGKPAALLHHSGQEAKSISWRTGAPALNFARAVLMSSSSILSVIKRSSGSRPCI